MKKHKSVVAILLSVMMIFTMMPAMVFATSWDSDFTHVTDDNGVQFETTRVFSDGLIEVTGKEKKATVIGEQDVPAPAGKKYYYELAGSALVSGTNALAGSTWTKTAFDNAFTIDPTTGAVTGASVKLVEPSYAEGYVAATPKSKTVDGFNGWTLAVTASGYDITKQFEDQTVTFTASVKAAGPISADTPNDPDVLGTIPSATVTVKGTAKTPAAAEFYFDSVGGTKVADGLMYDGAAHTVVGENFDGWTLSYETYNADTGRYVSASTVSVTDVQDPIRVRATYKKTGQADVVKDFNVQLKKATGAIVEFKTDKKGRSIFTVEGTSYNKDDYVVVNPAVTYDKTDTDDEKAAEKVADAATAKAVEANKAAILAYFNEKYDITDEAYEFNPNAVELGFEAKDLTQAEKNAIEKKYEALKGNFNFIRIVENDYAMVALNGVDLTDFEIEFTNAPAKKTIKTKKSKSTKTVKFSVNAECKNGTLVKYKLVNAPKKSITIDANTGKITVKKGLAKGTYTFKVKAYIPASRIGYLIDDDNPTAVSELQTIKVVVKKTKK